MMTNMSVPKPRISSSSPPMKTVFVKSGFALGPAGSLSKSARHFRIVIEGMRLLSPAQIRNLLHNRKSLEEIKMLIEEEANPSFIYWGTMSLEGKSYRLSDVDIRSRDTETVLRAEIRRGSDCVISSETSGDVMGRIEVNCRALKDAGTLIMNCGTLRGRYALHLKPEIEGGSL
jgi:hypothetical protein